MKKIYSLMAALLMLLMCSTTVSAQTTIGSIDNSAGWWTAFSDGYTIESGKAYRFQFKNHSRMGANHENWVLVAATNGTRDAAQGYSEYCVLRNDNYGWGRGGSLGEPTSTFAQHVNISNDFNWNGTSFNTDMNGSTVDMIVKYEKGKAISVDATIKTLAQKEYTYTFKYFDTNELTADNITAFFTVEGAHLENFTAEEYVEEDPSPYEIVGKKNFSTGYLGARSTPVTLKPGQQYQYKFINHNNGASSQNWHNWIFAASQSGQDKVVVRADHYETVKGNGDGCTSGYTWATFKDDYNGAEVTLTITYTTDNVLQTHAMIRKADGNTFVPNYEYDSQKGGITLSGDLSIALSVENAWVEIMEEKFVNPLVQEKATGLTDCSTGYLGASTEKKTLTPGGKNYVYNFINRNDATNANPYNWILVVSQGNDNIAVVRADNYEVIGGKIDGFTSAINWDTFMSDLHNANVTVTVEYSAANVLTISAKTKKATTLAAKPLKATDVEDEYLAPYSWSSAAAGLSISGDIQVAMSVDHSWIEMLSEGFDNTTGIRNISAADVKAKKTMRNGKLYIKTAKGTFNAAGAIVEK